MEIYCFKYLYFMVIIFQAAQLLQSFLLKVFIFRKQYHIGFFYFPAPILKYYLKLIHYWRLN